jgi:hypothetical protein
VSSGSIPAAPSRRCSPAAFRAGPPPPWLHETNPAGPDAVWLARAADGRPIGTAAIHGRRIVVDGRVYRAGQAADFVVDPAARGFGPALALQRAVMTACDSGEFAFLYGFPNAPARAIFERIGYRPGKSRRLARPLRSQPYLARYRASIARCLATPLDVAIHLVSRETYARLPRGTRLEPVTAFGDWFDAFWPRVRDQHVVVADRDSRYMNWRYANWPARKYDFAILRHGGEAVATIVWYRLDDVVHVAEAFALAPRWFDALVATFLRAQWRAGAAAVSLISLGDGGPAPLAAARRSDRPRRLVVPLRGRHSVDMGGPEMAPHTPQRSARPG